MDRMDGRSGWVASVKMVRKVKISMEIRTVCNVEDD
jgi:hypothetical protein